METRIAYFDETGDDGILKTSSDIFVLTSLYMSTASWQSNFDAMRQCRKNLKTTYGFHVSNEMHTRSFLTDKGEYRQYGWTPEQRRNILIDYTKAVAALDAITLLEKARALAENASDHRDWGTIADYYGKAAMAQHSGTYLPNWAEARADIERFFATWVALKYNMLSGSIDRKRPVLLSKVADFVRRSGKRIAIIVMDGMSFENFYTIQREMVESNLAFEVESSFSFFPTVTCVARQSIFSGKLPSEHAKPFSLENEEKQWRTFWKNTGLHEQEIYFSKGIPGSIPSEAKAVGIVINIVDDLMHSELQGYKGIQQGLCEWTKSGQLAQILKRLISDGYGVFMTSDHGNTAAIAEGRFAKPGVLAEPASRRAVIYNASFDARELDKFNVMRYSGTYLPDGYTAYLFNADSCYGDTGKEYITHGGMTLEETVVPFVRVGAYNG